MLSLRYQVYCFVIGCICTVGGLQVRVTQSYGALHDKAVMQCSFIPTNVKVAHIIWRKGTHPLGDMAYYFGAAARSQSGPGEYFKNRTVRGEINFLKGYHEITIVRTIESDEGLYTCIIMLENRADEISGGGYLILAVLPAKVPEIRDEYGKVLSNTHCQGKHIPSETVNGITALVCHAFASKPGPIITWNSNFTSQLHEVHRTYLRAGEKILRAAESWIKVSPNSDGHLSTVVCTVYSVNPEFGKSLRTDICLHLSTNSTANDLSCPTENNWMPNSVAVCILALLAIMTIALFVISWKTVKKIKDPKESFRRPNEESGCSTCNESNQYLGNIHRVSATYSGIPLLCTPKPTENT